MDTLPSETPTKNPDPAHDRSFLLGLIGGLLFFWFILPVIYPPAARYTYLALYPITIIGTFIHEMGHGLASLATGGSFLWLQIEFFRGGSAITAGGWRLMILLGGLLGPAITGAVLLAVSTRVRPRWVMITLALYFVLGIFFMVKPLWYLFTGFSDPLLDRWQLSYLATLLVPVALLAATLKFMQFSEVGQRYFIQFLGVISCLAGFSSNSYIFMYEPLAGGGYSDARMIAGTFWTGPETVPFFWFVVFASIITVTNIAAVLYGTWLALKPTGSTPAKT
ncbi:M50 family metallopeptidase [Acanthopleuribacter pedis]|uniref:M50 family metallopeptidase n=1 Tax=Acanthopleuribacter pedis TaxID=442870 RepID=A0A8J7U3G4_9BACT|nr:M50 family metallopeptidase [Acanthopleuribacter pedis]MBO1318734.1 M50 family metallopeptidase [Acanthopleuribacter pedis]